MSKYTYSQVEGCGLVVTRGSRHVFTSSIIQQLHTVWNIQADLNKFVMITHLHMYTVSHMYLYHELVLAYNLHGHLVSMGGSIVERGVAINVHWEGTVTVQVTKEVCHTTAKYRIKLMCKWEYGKKNSRHKT